MFLVKLGGSVITNKAKSCSFQQEIMERLASEIKKADTDLIVIHGAGSFGHILAKQHNLNDGYTKKSQLLGFSRTHAMVQQLNSLVLDCLHNNDIPAVGLPPHAFLTLDNHRVHTFSHVLFEDYLHGGFVPVSFGDVALDQKLRFSICSGDLLMQELAAHFSPEKVIFVMDEDGLYTSNPKTNPQARFIERTTVDELSELTTSKNTYDDVTQGMEGKINVIQAIANLGIDTMMINGKIENRLYDTLVGDHVKGTLIKGEKR